MSAGSIGERPIKKVLEAKARKKNKTKRIMDRVTQKATAINDNDTLTEKEKISHIRQLFKRAKKSTKEDKVCCPQLFSFYLGRGDLEVARKKKEEEEEQEQEQEQEQEEKEEKKRKKGEEKRRRRRRRRMRGWN